MATFNGSSGNDTFAGTNGIDTAHGNAGDDVLEGSGANDTLDGGAGADFVSGGGANDQIFSHSASYSYEFGYPRIAGSSDIYAEKDTLLGGTGDDTLVSGIGDDVDGGFGTNYLYVSFQGSTGGVHADFSTLWNSPSLTIMGGTYQNIHEVSYIEGSNFDDYLSGVEGLGEIYGRGGNDHIISSYSTGDTYGGDGADVIDGTGNAYGSPMYGESGDDTLIGGHANDRQFGGSGDDQLFGNHGFDTLQGEDGNDLLDGGDSNDTLYGGVGLDTLAGSSGSDSLDGGTGDDLLRGDDTFGYDDTLDGGEGSDTLYGGGGNDALYSDGDADQTSATDSVFGDDGNDTLWVGFGDLADGGNGVDTVNLHFPGATQGQTFDLSAVLSGQQFSIGSGTVKQVEKIGSIHATGFDDTVRLSSSWAGTDLYGGAGNDLLELLGTDSRLYGEYGNDRLTGGSYNDRLDGGWGFDTADYARATAGVTITLMTTSAQNTGGAGSDTLVSIENLSGSGFNDQLTGSNSANHLAGGAGNDALVGLADNDTLEAGTGMDTLSGGIGNDIYLVSDLADEVVELINAGTDEVRYSGGTGNYLLSANVENLALVGSAAVTAHGNELGNRITGNAAASVLYGLGGDDTLVSGVGGDVLRGGVGNDTYLVNSTADQTIEAASEGMDEVQSSLSWTLASQVEDLTLTGTAAVSGTGNSLNNYLVGNAAANILGGGDGADTLDGAVGADAMQGGAGNDTYLVENAGDKITELPGGGYDTVKSSLTWILGTEVEHLTLTGTGAINGSGNSLNNQLTGNDAANVLNGGVGNDTLTGGLGNDTYGVDSTGDKVVEVVGGGVDAIHSSISWILGTEVETLLLTGTAAINASGNALNNQLTGNAGNNLINGNGGADTMTGGAGNDTYGVDSSTDQVVESAGGGIDSVNSSATWTLSAEVENLVLTGGSVINGTGNTLANRLTGNAAANILSGAAGADTLTGGLGNDTYRVDSLLDVVVELSNSGVDTVESAVNWTLGAAVENLTLTGTAGASAVGNAFNNYLTGNTGANIIDGGSGADTMRGGGGADTFIVDNVADVVVDDTTPYYREEEATIKSSVSWDLQQVHQLVLTGTNAINGTGTEYDDNIMGNSANNILNGEKGNDTLTGGAGDDLYMVDSYWDNVVEQSGGGMDTIQYSSYEFRTLPDNVENIELIGAAYHVAGNSLANRIIGNSAVGQNFLNGGAGADTLVGGKGNDSYFVDDAGDTIIEQGGGGGHDIVYSDISWGLNSEIEVLMLNGGLATNAIGNDLSNDIYGNDNSNLIDGGRGADTMAGGYGNDTYIVDNVGDETFENFSFGIDKVQSSISWTLSDDVEDLSLTGTGAINGTGNHLGNSLIGNSAANFLTGGFGADRLTGGAGADTFALDDLLSSDTITDFTSATDKLRIAQSTLRVGDGDTVVEGAKWQYGAGGFSTSAELVIVAHDIAGAINTTSAATSIGSASSAYATGQTQLFIVDNGSQAALYLFKAANVDATVSASELTLLATLQGTATTAVEDVIFSA